MNKTSFLFFILSLFLIDVVYAEYSQEVYSNWSYAGDSFSVDGHRFDVSINVPQNKVGIEIEGVGGVILLNDSCSTDIANYSICARNIVWGYFNTTTHLEQYKAYIEIEQFLAQLSATKEVSQTSLLIGESSRVTVIITNSGSIAANNVLYEDAFEGFTVSEISGCSLTGNGLRWQGSLQAGGSQKCSFTITASQAAVLSSEGTITYYNGRESKQISTIPSVTISVSDYPLKINSSISAKEVEIGRNATVNIILTNTHGTYPLEVNKFTVDVPYELKTLEKSAELNLINNKYFWTGELMPGESITFYVVLQGTFIGNFSIEKQANYMINNYKYETISQIPLDVYLKEPKIVFQKNDVMHPGEKTHIRVYITNPNSDYIFKDVQFEFSSNIPESRGIKKTVSELKKNSYETIYESDFNAPAVDTETEYSLKVKASYKSVYGQYLMMENESYITVLPETVVPANNSREEIIPEPAQINTTANQTTGALTNDEQVTAFITSTEEGFKEKIKLSGNYFMSSSFILLDIITLGLLVFAFIKLK